MSRTCVPQGVWAEMPGVQPEPFLLFLYHARRCAYRYGAIWLTQSQEDFPARGTGAHFLEIKQKGVTHLGRQRIGLRLAVLEFFIVRLRALYETYIAAKGTPEEERAYQAFVKFVREEYQ